jgi:hypothetical protein
MQRERKKSALSRGVSVVARRAKAALAHAVIRRWTRFQIMLYVGLERRNSDWLSQSQTSTSRSTNSPSNDPTPPLSGEKLDD